MSDTTHQPLRMLTIREVTACLGVSDTTLYRLIGRGQFPKPTRVTPNCARWYLRDVEAYVQGQPVALRPPKHLRTAQEVAADAQLAAA
jgi:prophage regulatory protein